MYTEGKRRLDQQFSNMLGPDGVNTSLEYQTALGELNDLVDKQARIEQNEFNALGTALNSAATNDEIKAAIKRYSPVSKNLGQAAFRWAKRTFKNQSFEAYSADQVKTMKDVLGLTDDDIAQLRELNSRGLNYGLSSDAVRRLPVFNDPNFKRNVEVYNDSQALFSSIMDSDSSMRDLYQQTAREANKKVLTPSEWRAATENYIADIAPQESIKFERTNFVERMVNASDPSEAVLQYVAERGDVTAKDQQARIKSVYSSAYDIATNVVSEQYMRDPSLIRGSNFDERVFFKRVGTVAESIVENNIKLVEDPKVTSWMPGSTLPEDLRIIMDAPKQASTEIEDEIRSNTLSISSGDSPAGDRALAVAASIGRQAMALPRSEGRKFFTIELAKLNEQIAKDNNVETVEFDPISEVEEIRRELFRKLTPTERRRRGEELVYHQI